MLLIHWNHQILINILLSLIFLPSSCIQLSSSSPILNLSCPQGNKHPLGNEAGKSLYRDFWVHGVWQVFNFSFLLLRSRQPKKQSRTSYRLTAIMPPLTRLLSRRKRRRKSLQSWKSSGRQSRMTRPTLPAGPTCFRWTTLTRLAQALWTQRLGIGNVGLFLSCFYFIANFSSRWMVIHFRQAKSCDIGICFSLWTARTKCLTPETPTMPSCRGTPTAMGTGRSIQTLKRGTELRRR